MAKPMPIIQGTAVRGKLAVVGQPIHLAGIAETAGEAASSSRVHAWNGCSIPSMACGGPRAAVGVAGGIAQVKPSHGSYGLRVGSRYQDVRRGSVDALDQPFTRVENGCDSGVGDGGENTLRL